MNIVSEYREKINININDEEDTIEYTLKKTYFFNQKESGCRTEDDVVVMLNAGLVVSKIFFFFIRINKILMNEKRHISFTYTYLNLTNVYY